MLKLLHSLPKLSWLPIGSCVRCAIRVFKGSRTCSSTEEDTICLGSLRERQAMKSAERFTFALNWIVSVTIHQRLLEISPESRNIFLESMGKKSLAAINAARSMLYALTGRPIIRSAVPRNTNVNVGLPSLGDDLSLIY